MKSIYNPGRLTPLALAMLCAACGGGGLIDDDLVKVEGSVNNGTLEASKVEGFDDLFDDVGDDDEVEIKGAITRFGSITDFDVNGVTVVTDAQTRYEDGTSSQLGIDVVVEVEGARSNGKLIAEEVDFEVEDTIKIDGTLQAVTATDASRNEDSVTLLGISLATDRSTFFDDDSDLEVSDFGLDDLRVGDYVEVEGYVSQSGAYIVTELQRDDSDISAILQGPLTATSLPNSITVLGQVIDTSAINAAILAGVQPGTIVKLNGDIVGGNFVATQVELQVGDD